MPKNYLACTKRYLNQIKPLAPIQTGAEPDFSKDNSIKAVVFDIYGTLIISASGDLDKAHMTIENINTAIVESGCAWLSTDYEKDANQLLVLFHDEVEKQQEALKQTGHPYPEVDIIKVWEQCIEQAEQNNWLKKNIDFDVYNLTVVFELLSNPVWPMPEMNPVLKRFKESNYPIGIVSNAQFYTPIIMNYFMDNEVVDKEFLNGFDEDISVFSYKLLRSKPDVFLFNELANGLKQKYNLEPSEVIFVGNDMLKDVWTASQCGFKTVLFAGDKRSLKLRETDERCKNLKADYTITQLNQLFEIIDIE